MFVEKNIKFVENERLVSLCGGLKVQSGLRAAPFKSSKPSAFKGSESLFLPLLITNF
jgi:hypothetical protein